MVESMLCYAEMKRRLNALEMKEYSDGKESEMMR